MRPLPLTRRETEDKAAGRLSSFDVLRRVVEVLSWTRETEVLSALDPCDLVRAVQSVRASGWDVYLDHLTPAELRLAVRGDVDALTKSLERLDS